jgi:hypothetical protein
VESGRFASSGNAHALLMTVLACGQKGIAMRKAVSALALTVSAGLFSPSLQQRGLASPSSAKAGVGGVSTL